MYKNNKNLFFKNTTQKSITQTIKIVFKKTKKNCTDGKHILQNEVHMKQVGF